LGRAASVTPARLRSARSTSWMARSKIVMGHYKKNGRLAAPVIELLELVVS
jgi:hypothetical protein